MMNKKNPLLISGSLALMSLSAVNYAAIDDNFDNIDITMDVSTNSNTPEAALQTALASICTGAPAPAGPDLTTIAEICAAIQNAAVEDTAEAYRQLSARSVSAITTLLSRGSLIMSLDDISSRLAALRRAARNQTNASLDQWRFNGKDRALAGLLDQSSGGAASADNNAISQSYFVSAAYINSEQDDTDALAGFDSDIYAATVGMDYRLSRNLFAGFATRLLSGDTELVQNGGSLDSRDTNLTYYVGYFPTQNFFLDGTLQASRGIYELTRKIDFTLPGFSPVRATTKGSTRGSQVGFTLGAGYEHYFSNMATTAQLTAKYRYNQAHLAGYRETGGGAVNLQMDGQNINTQVFSLGGQLSKAFSYSGGVILPQIDLVWKHDFETDGQEVGASFVSDPNGTTFVYRTDERDSDFFELSLGVSSINVGGLTSFIQYTSLIGYDNYSQSLLSLGVRKEF